MGDPRRLRKKYETPRHPWQKERILEEKHLLSAYGLKNKKEIWRAKTVIVKYKYLARKLVGKPPAERKAEEEKLLGKLIKLGLLKESANLDDVLSLKTEDLLERRLQTIAWKKGFANTVLQARQFIVHGRISIGKKKATVPGEILDTAMEKLVDWYSEPIKTTPRKLKQETAKQDKARIEEAPKKIAKVLEEIKEKVPEIVEEKVPETIEEE
jgi:small subunit ribosomal protein S4